jgi:large subunit ribosomal protein L15
MKELSKLAPTEGAKKTRKRVGRGIGSGLGKTSARGHKGTGARTGKGRPAYFEGGQMPLQRRIPKRGFEPLKRKEYALVNVAALEAFEDGASVDPATLQAAGLVRKLGDGVKLLGDGDCKRKLNVTVHAVSASARAKIEGAGGTVRLIVASATAQE